MSAPPQRTRLLLTLGVGAAVGALAPQPWSDILLALVILPAIGLNISAIPSLRGSRGWQRIAISTVLIGFSPALTEIHRSIDANIGPLTAGDAMLITGYLTFGSGILRVLEARTMAFQVRPVLDALLIALWTGFVALAWAGPQLADRLTVYPLLAALLYLPLTLAMLMLFLQLVLGAGERARSVWMLTTIAALTVVSELAFLAVAAGQEPWRRLAVGAPALATVLLSAAVRDPSAPTVEEPVAYHQQPLSVGRSLALLGSFAAVALVLIAADGPPLYLAVMLLPIFAVTSASLVLGIIQRERIISVEQELRRSVAEIMRAPSTDQVLHLGGRAVDRLLAGKRFCAADLVRRTEKGWLTAPDDAPVPLGTDDDRAGVERAVRTGSVVRTEQAVSLAGADYGTHLTVPFRRDAGDHVDALVVFAAPVLSMAEIDQLQQVVDIMERALVGLHLHEQASQRRANRRFRSLVQDSNEIVVVVDADDHTVRMVSPSVGRILGFSEHETIGRPAQAAVHRDDLPMMDALFEQAIANGSSHAVDLRLQHRDGHFTWFTARIRDETTDPDVNGLVVNLADIQDRKMAELTLAQSEQRYRALVLNSRDVFVVLEPDLTINYVSPNVERVLGVPPGDLVAANISGILTEQSRNALVSVVEAGRLAVQSETLELELRTYARRCIAEVTVTGRDEDAGYTVTISDVTDRRELEQSLRRQALHDQLTGLANRSTLHFELQQTLQRLAPGEQVGLIHLDVDDFKAVNESIGYEAGDQLLVRVAARLRSALREGDVLARVGGNEFAVVSVSSAPDFVENLAIRLTNLFSQPFEVSDREMRLTVSIGYHCTDDRRAVARDLIDRATLALGAARADTQASIRVFEPRLRETAMERFELAADLQMAIGRNQLHVVYQPIIDLATRNVRSVEALMRWNHPDRGPVSPGIFIPLAEKSGLVIELGRWILARACDQMLRWTDVVAGAEELTVSVNVSAIQLEQVGEAERLAEIVENSGLAPERVTLELTESTLIEDSTWIRSQLEVFRQLGMRIAVDDFGTGAAGLSHLRDVPFDVVKIDKSYVDALRRSEEALRLVQGVIDLAHGLGAITVAEGIEDPEDSEVLQSLGCDRAQGFFYGRPMDPEQLEGWFAKGRTGAAPALIARATSNGTSGRNEPQPS